MHVFIDAEDAVVGKVQELQELQSPEALGHPLQLVGGEVHLFEVELPELIGDGCHLVVLEVESPEVGELSDGGGQGANVVVLAPEDDDPPTPADVCRDLLEVVMRELQDLEILQLQDRGVQD
jgi:hypothetical protein